MTSPGVSSQPSDTYPDVPSGVRIRSHVVVLRPVNDITLGPVVWHTTVTGVLFGTVVTRSERCVGALRTISEYCRACAITGPGGAGAGATGPAGRGATGGAAGGTLGAAAGGDEEEGDGDEGGGDEGDEAGGAGAAEGPPGPAGAADVGAGVAVGVGSACPSAEGPAAATAAASMPGYAGVGRGAASPRALPRPPSGSPTSTSARIHATTASTTKVITAADRDPVARTTRRSAARRPDRMRSGSSRRLGSPTPPPRTRCRPRPASSTAATSPPTVAGPPIGPAGPIRTVSVRSDAPAGSAHSYPEPTNSIIPHPG